MCVPCAKEIINHVFGAATGLAATVRILSLKDPVEISQDQDDNLYVLAEAEIEAIEAVKKAAVKMAKMQGSPHRWVKLIERL